jgi:hypothetical protein
MQADGDNACTYHTTMRNFFCHHVIWLMLAVVPLNATATYLPYVVFSAPSLETSSVQEQQGARGLLFKVSPSVALELSLDHKRQHKRLLTPIPYTAALAQGQVDAGHRRLTAVRCFSRISFFFPRKLSPRSGTDDPFPIPTCDNRFLSSLPR